MNERDFNKARQDAINQMHQMSNRSTNLKPPPEKENSNQKSTNTSAFSGFNIPFLENLKTDSDLTLIIGILLLLLSEKADKRLLFALIYILL